MLTIVYSPVGKHQSLHKDWMVEGFSHLGIETKTSHDVVQTKHVACWGWRKGKELREKGHEVIVMERGYIGDRMHYTSLGLNGLNGHATFPQYPDDAGKRFAEHGGAMKPWREDGEYILILGQVKNDASLQGKDITGFYQQAAAECSAYYGKPVYFRPHPEAIRRNGYTRLDGVPIMKGDLKDSLAGAFMTVAYNSNSCLDSIMEGVPCLAGDKGTMVYDLCMHHFKDMKRPDRETILHNLAWCQWSPEEISSGYPLKALACLLSL